MPISVTCQQCGKVLQARESAAGKRSTCPGCGQVITIPEIHEGLLALADRAAAEVLALPDETPSARVQKRGAPGHTYPNDDDLTPLDWLMSVCCPCISCVMGLVYLLQGKPSGAKLIGLSIVMPFLLALLLGMLMVIRGG